MQVRLVIAGVIVAVVASLIPVRVADAVGLLSRRTSMSSTVDSAAAPPPEAQRVPRRRDHSSPTKKRMNPRNRGFIRSRCPETSHVWLCFEIPEPGRDKGSREAVSGVFHEEPQIFPRPRSGRISVTTDSDASGRSPTTVSSSRSGWLALLNADMSTAMRQPLTPAAGAGLLDSVVLSCAGHPRDF